MKKTCNIFVTIGMFLIIGAAGSCDFGSATLSKAILLMICGFALCISGLLLPKHLSKCRRKKRTMRKNACKANFRTKKHAPAENAAEARRSFVLITEV